MNLIDTISNFSSQTVALIAMGLCYILLFTEKLNRAVTTVLIATALIIIGNITEQDAIEAIDFNTISL